MFICLKRITSFDWSCVNKIKSISNKNQSCSLPSSSMQKCLTMYCSQASFSTCSRSSLLNHQHSLPVFGISTPMQTPWVMHQWMQAKRFMSAIFKTPLRFLPGLVVTCAKSAAIQENKRPHSYNGSTFTNRVLYICYLSSACEIALSFIHSLWEFI